MKLQTKWAGRNLIYFDSLDSTNARARLEAIKGAAHGTLVAAGRQTRGRGRSGKSWFSPPNTNIYFTILLRPDFLPEKAAMLTLVMAYSVARCVKAVTGMRAGIKWPNDIIINKKKICGILTEMDVDNGRIGYVIIGVGINVAKQEFPAELAEMATSLEQECGNEINKDLLFERIMGAFEEDYEDFVFRGDLSGLQAGFEDMLVNQNARVSVLDPKGKYQGTAKGITSKGELLVENDEGVILKVYAGEVSVRGIYGYV